MFSDSTALTMIPDFLLKIPTFSETQLPWSPSFSASSCRWQAYLNQCCLYAFLPWLQEECDPTANVWTNPAELSSFWEFVNGTAISIQGKRLVLIPTEAIDTDELRVPQEWVDIPTLASDYYLAIQVNPDEQWIRVVGYTTHLCLKTLSSYDAKDRSYCLNSIDLIQDLNVLWLSRQLCLEEPTQTELPPLPQLSLEQATNLLDRLSNLTITFPRSSVPFTFWGALIAHGGWRKRLYERRQGLPQQWLIQQWFQSGVSNVAQQLGWQRQIWVPIRSGIRSTTSSTVLSRQLVINDYSYELRVSPKGELGDHIWRFELRSSSSGHSIPAGFKLRLLTEDLQPFENNEDIALAETEQLYVEVMIESGEGLVWEIEPTPAGYEQEILQF